MKPQVLKVPAYTLHAYDAEVKLNQNENPYDFPDDLKEETYRRFRNRQWSRYPDFIPESLHKQLADFVGWRPDGVLVGNGSNELLQATLTVLIKSRSKVAIPAPTFTVYRLISTVLGAEVVGIPLKEDLAFDVDALIDKSIESGAGVLIVNTPNNPTGAVLRGENLRLILDRFPGHVLLDEAYYEFWGQSGLEFLKDYPRLIITRTFSKAMGMASLRVGYMLAHPELTTQVAKAKLPYNVNQFSLTAAEVALENISRFRPPIEAVLQERDRLVRELGQMPDLKVHPTEANFFLIEVPVEPKLVFQDLFAQGILIRDVSSYPMLSKCLRISVGTPEENNRLLSALRASLSARVSPA